MIRINQLKLPVGHSAKALENRIRKVLRIGDAEFTYEIRRQSLDARKKDEKCFVYTVDVKIPKEEKILKKLKDPKIQAVKEERYQFPKSGEHVLKDRPVIVGSGPAGLFCAYYLARAGYRPLVIERGEKARDRQKSVEKFWKDGVLDPDSNVQFGEGGAGTFSDGKLNTQVKDPIGRSREVMERFVQAGAPAEILYQQKPHLGTDVLVGLVENLREEIIRMGGDFQFRTCMTGILTEDGAVCGIRVKDAEGEREIPAGFLVLAIGHSARDTFEMLYASGIHMEAKSFAMGVRVEHPQSMINLDQYGEEENPHLGAAAYKLTHNTEKGRGVYSFCMCPGGWVVNASSEAERLAVNGMSYQARDSRNANSAIIVTVTPEDYGGDHPLSGMVYQRELERAAYRAAGGKVPVQLLADFRENRPSEKLGEVQPCIKGEWALSNVRSFLPAFMGEAISEGMEAFGRKIKGFNRPDTLIDGLESRTSSPVRIVREPGTLTGSLKGLYPCGEGAGYAGGITSAAMDGIKVAEACAAYYKPMS